MQPRICNEAVDTQLRKGNVMWCRTLFHKRKVGLLQKDAYNHGEGQKNTCVWKKERSTERKSTQEISDDWEHLADDVIELNGMNGQVTKTSNNQYPSNGQRRYSNRDCNTLWKVSRQVNRKTLFFLSLLYWRSEVNNSHQWLGCVVCC